jgi:methylated-DNA-[protein]-cysteine S-methyltransferase
MGTLTVPSPLGRLAIHEEDGAIVEIAFAEEGADEGSASALLDEAAHQLSEYFAGRLARFDLPLAPRGTDFQQRVWHALLDVKPGTTTSYQALAQQVGSVARAVGLANGANPIAIVVPCHRVIGANGSLTGYAGGLERKRWLLRHEGAILA